MTGFRNFVIGCSLAAASLITPVGPVQAMPLQAPDLQIKAQGDVQNVQYYHRRTADMADTAGEAVGEAPITDADGVAPTMAAPA